MNQLPPGLISELIMHPWIMGSILFFLASAFIALLVFIYKRDWNMISRLETKIDQYVDISLKCQAALPERFVALPTYQATIAELFHRQNTLRENTLPKEFVARSEFMLMLQALEDKIGVNRRLETIEAILKSINK